MFYVTITCIDKRGRWKMMDLLLQSFQMKSMSIFEAGMLICFGASWPFAVMKTYRTKNVKGKSRLFLTLIIIGYICGIVNKVINTMDIVFWLYVINLILVSADAFLVLVYRNTPQNQDK